MEWPSHLSWADVHASTPASVGGGVLNYADLTLSNAVVSANTALGESYAVYGDSFIRPGSGFGGGIASFVGSFNFDSETSIEQNHASIRDDNISQW